jgi:hypothetical protein
VKATRSMAKILVLASGLWVALACAGEEKPAIQPLYANDFEKLAPGKLPDEFMVLDGAFAVAQERGNKFMELPGAPLDSYSVQFGPPGAAEVAVSARIFGTAKGRRSPVFGVGLNGVSGYKLRVVPGKKALELTQEEEVKASAPFEWQSGAWTRLRLQVRKAKEGEWKVEGKAWPEGSAEPAQWPVSCVERAEPPAGRASVLGSPFSGTPIRYDDLVVSKVGGVP